MAKYSILLPIFLVFAVAVTAIVVQQKPFKRLIPADVLRGKNNDNHQKKKISFAFYIVLTLPIHFMVHSLMSHSI